MSRFQVGPAKLRDGQDVFVTHVDDWGVKGFMMSEAVAGAWRTFSRGHDGAVRNDRHTSYDVMPNVPEAEVLE